MSSLGVLPRRLVRKAFDGREAAQAFLLQNTGTISATIKSTLSEYLLQKGVCPTDVSKMMGMPIGCVRMLAGHEWDNRRVGRAPSHIGAVLGDPGSHMRASLFVQQVFYVSALRKETVITGESFAYAMMALDSLVGDFRKDSCQPRYLQLAVQDVLDKKCEMVNCQTCRSKYLRSNIPLKIQKGCFGKGECPFCKHIKNRQLEGRRNSGKVTRKSHFGAANGTYGGEVREDVSEQLFDFLEVHES